MTTLVGIVSRKDEPVVVLGADRQSTYDDAKRKKLHRKILIDRSGKFAYAMSGTWDDKYYSFVDDLYTGKIDLQRRLKRGYFPELKKMNLKRTGDKLIDDDSNRMMIVSRSGPVLYTIWPAGMVEKPVFWAHIGPNVSLEYLSAITLHPFEISVEDATMKVLEALRLANGSVYSACYDLAVIRKSGIDYYGDFIQEELEKSREAIFNEVLRQIKHKKKK